MAKDGYPLFDDRDLVRLMIQCLNSMGYHKTGKCLEGESHEVVEDPTIQKLRIAVLEGEWDNVIELLPCLHPPSSENTHRLKYVVYRQKYLELLERGDKSGALKCLRFEITPLQEEKELKGSKQLQKSLAKLTNLVLCNSRKELHARASWVGHLPDDEGDSPGNGKEDEKDEKNEKNEDGEDANAGHVRKRSRSVEKGRQGGNSREKVLSQLRRYIAPDILVPENRLKCLVNQAVQQQEKNCEFHNVEVSSLTLFEDHRCSRSTIPDHCVSILKGHSDEVWFVKYSHNGKMLASCSRNGTTVIWGISTSGAGTILHKLEADEAVSFVAWSPDDSKILVCGSAPEVQLWDVQKGILTRTFNYHTDSVSSCCWIDDNTFASGGIDKIVTVSNINTKDSKPSHQWETDRVYDLACSGSMIAAAVTPKQVVFIDIESGIHDYIKETEEISSISISRDGRYMLTNPSDSRNEMKEIHLWDLQQHKIIQRYRGHMQCRYVIRSCFGGANDGFVLGGSEDGHVCVWHRHRGDLLLKMKGHTKPSNSVSWNPQNPLQFASASDDKTIRIWMPESQVIGNFHEDYFDADDALID